MTVFLIDYENLRTVAFNGLEALSEEDRVIVFYTNNSDNLTFSLMQRLVESKAKVEYKKVACGGKNSLDFQLCSYLGYLIGTNKDTRFCVVSRDKGFLTMLSLWGESAENGNSVICCTNILNGSARRPVEESEVDDRITDEILASPDAALEEQAPAENAAEEQPVEEIPQQVVESEAKAEPESEIKPEPEQEPAKPQRKRRTYKRKPKTPAAEQTA